MEINNLKSIYFFFKGRVALYATLKASGVKPGDEIILPGFTCVVVPNAITYLGAKPVYVDIDPETYNINPKRIEEKITERTRAIIAQHTFGIPAEMDNIVDIARRNNIYVIEDSCHAIGSRYKGQDVGTFGDAAFFSSQWSKPLTTGFGGWAVINNKKLIRKMRNIYREFREPSYRDKILLRLQYFTYSKIFKTDWFWFIQGAYRRLANSNILIGSSTNMEIEYKMPEGYEKIMSQWQRNLLEKKMAEIKTITNHRQWITSIYKNLFRQKGIKTIKLPEEYEAVFLRYPVLVKDKIEVLEEAKKMRIELGDWFLSPVHPNIEGWEKAGYQNGLCPVAENICKHIINLPTHKGIRGKKAEEIIEFISNY
jgi:perosamine synthetase